MCLNPRYLDHSAIYFVFRSLISQSNCADSVRSKWSEQSPRHEPLTVLNFCPPTPRNDSTDSVHKPRVQNEANDNSTSVDIPPD